MTRSSATTARLNLLFIIDPIETLIAGHDSTVALMESAQSRGHNLFAATIHDLEIDDSRAVVLSQPISVDPAILIDGHWEAAREWYEAGARRRRFIDDFDAVFMRKDPPVDADYLRATFILDLVDSERTVVINRPSGLRDANEKLFALRTPEIGPETLVSSDIEHIVERVAKWGRAVLKPTDAMAGRGIVVLTPGDVNLRSLIESATERGQHQVVVQRWVDESALGDRRVIVLDGLPIGVVRRVAEGADFRCNMATGARPVADEITERDHDICAVLAPHLRENGLVFVGIDVIGDRLTEVNVTSPTGIREIDALSGTDLAGEIIEWVVAARARQLAASVG